MSGWVKVPEDWFASEDVERLPAEVVVFHLSALAESSRHLTDGRISARMIRRLWPVSNPRATIDQLVSAGWWETSADEWLIPQWHDFILSSGEVDTIRKQNATRQERHRRHVRGDHSMCDRCKGLRNAVTHAVSNGVNNAPPNLSSPNLSDPKGRRRGEGGREPRPDHCEHGYPQAEDGSAPCAACAGVAIGKSKSTRAKAVGE